MASLSINVDARGKNQVRLCISNNHTKVYIPIGMSVNPACITKDIHNPITIPPGCSMCEAAAYAKCYENIINNVRKCEVAILELTQSGKIYSMTAASIRDYIYGEQEVKIVRHISKTDILLVDALRTYAESRSSNKYKQSFTYTIQLLERFDPDIESMLLRKVNTSFVKDFELWMTGVGLGISTRGIALRNIKIICNDAIDRGWMSADNYPFRKFKIAHKKSVEIDYLTIEEMQKLLSLDFTNQQGEHSLTIARDVLMISFMCCGANLRDIYNFGKLSGDEIVFVRSKIQRTEPRPVHIKVLPELQVLIDKYKGKEHLFWFAERDGSFDTFQQNLNGRFVRISKLMGRKVNLAIIRHTWATLCFQNGIDRTVIDKSLGHVENDVSGIYYIQYDWDMTYKANKKITTKVLEGVVVNSVPTRTQIRA